MTRASLLRWLLIQWIVGAGVVTLLLALQVLAGKHGDPAKIWGWVAANLLPSLSLLITANLSPANKTWAAKPAGQFKVWLALGAGGGYLLGVLAIVLAEPFLPNLTLGQALDAAGFPLGVVQGLVVAAISAALFDGR